MYLFIFFTRIIYFSNYTYVQETLMDHLMHPQLDLGILMAHLPHPQ